MDHEPPPFVEARRGTTSLGPDHEFPADLAGLALVELQVLHSRICHQLDHEYLTGPDGPHPVTLDRYRELSAQLDAREGAAAGAAS
ncbi:hypothetical protein ACFYE2_11920 [Kocuria sp. CPCC 205300]|uniref:hypothetical protein n=1 Tax=Kocuria sabuli TaxID=3071448 RepID=UPI0036D8CAE8